MNVKVGLVQESPVFFDKDKTLDKTEALVRQYANEGCQLLMFPESFIPGYPRGFDFGTKIGRRTQQGRELYAKYYDNSIDVEGPEIKRLEKLAKTNTVYLVIGITEKQKTNNSLYCSMVYISPTDGLLGVHRKIKPTGSERLIWAEADGESLVTYQTKIGRLGGLICWENYMPLARMAMYQKGVEIYLAPTADSRDGWTATLRHIALEGRCFVLGCNQYFTKDMYPEEYKKLVVDASEALCRGGSIIVNPLGEVIAGPLFDKAGLLTAELNLNELTESKFDFDVIGHYSRNDIFKYQAINQPDTRSEKN